MKTEYRIQNSGVRKSRISLCLLLCASLLSPLAPHLHSQTFRPLMVTNVNSGLADSDTNFFGINSNRLNAAVNTNNAANYAAGLSTNSTNFSLSLGAAGSNYTATLGTNGTNFSLTMGLNGTNLALALGALGSNYTATLSTNATNNALALGTSVTNALALKLNLTGGTISSDLFVSGKLGVNTTSATRKFEIKTAAGSINNNIALLEPGGGLQASVSLNANNNELLIASAAAIRWFAGAVFSDTVTLPTNERMALTAGGSLQLSQITSGGTPAANTALIYAKDVAGTAEMFVKDEAGNELQISSHPQTAPSSFYIVTNWIRSLPEIKFTANYYIGVVEWQNISLQTLLRKWELRGTNIAGLPAGQRAALAAALHEEETFAEYNTRLGYTNGHPSRLVAVTWSAIQDTLQARYDAERDAEIAASALNTNVVIRPIRDVRKTIPAWLQNRIR
jgi:hypothetical protein